MHNNNKNPWDGRRPSLGRWWESDESKDNEIPKMPTSPTAIQNTKQWIDRSSGLPNKNTARKTCIAKKTDTSEICKPNPCLCMKLKSAIRANTDRLTDDVCGLYDRWVREQPLAGDSGFRGELLTLVGLLKKIIKDLNGTTGNHGELESLMRRYNECRDKYRMLLTQLDRDKPAGRFGESDG